MADDPTRSADPVRLHQEHEIERMRLELLELADALEVMRRRWPAPSSKRWADRLIKRTKDRHYEPWLDSVAAVLLNDGGEDGLDAMDGDYTEDRG